MPLPSAILFSVALTLFSAYLSVAADIPALPALTVIGSALWVYFDARKLGLSRYRTGLIGPEVATIGCLGVWIIAFPWYLSARHKILHGLLPLKESAPPEA
ncbi:MAG TPA: hypothetical protein VGO40_12725 [Longimicrobium sp.]|jgi:hypothetical protein|nr:hypothetical protein [Longimicrobium sp.]